MRKFIGILAVLLVLAIGGAVAAYYLTNPDLPHGPQAFTHESGQAFSEVERGRYLVTVADCGACHTEPNGRAFAGGRPIETPFGKIAAANITPDAETGIGSWTDTDLANALQRGIGKDGHMIYPAMPFVYYTKMTRADVNAIHAYLRTVAPVRRSVQSNLLPFPFNIRVGMRLWDALFFREGRFKPDASRGEKWNRGAYLVEAAEHCGACHTPKNILGADRSDAAYQGNTVQGWFAPNITDDKRRGLGSWSEADIVQYLRTGHNRVASASGPMAEEVMNSSAFVTDGDLEAIATYLKSLPGQNDGGEALDPHDARMQAGKAVFDDSCAACHRRNGAGIAGLFPMLKGSPSVQSREPTSLIRVVLDGAKSVATAKAPTGAAMPSYNWLLKDDQVAAVLTYIRNSWGNQASPVTTAEVAARRKELQQRPF